MNIYELLSQCLMSLSESWWDNPKNLFGKFIMFSKLVWLGIYTIFRHTQICFLLLLQPPLRTINICRKWQYKNYGVMYHIIPLDEFIGKSANPGVYP